MRIANDTDYGLSGAVWTATSTRRWTSPRRLRTGTVAVNNMSPMDFGARSAASSESGLGRELGPEGLGEYLEYKTITLPQRLITRFSHRPGGPRGSPGRWRLHALPRATNR